ncbi:hypothetical protein FH972_001017 [Carpinus fangiana]|uniref:Uncharacterized protein n=1 Tax=Carpinus fangiana TaxID=176857 RepID=A0A5N6QDK9_9ROSI|nr:hypothetical protein FH972_001017 [Carpinus fangiana]
MKNIESDGVIDREEFLDEENSRFQNQPSFFVDSATTGRMMLKKEFFCLFPIIPESNPYGQSLGVPDLPPLSFESEAFSGDPDYPGFNADDAFMKVTYAL